MVYLGIDLAGCFDRIKIMDELIKRYLETKKDYYSACEELKKEMELKGVKRVELSDMTFTIIPRTSYISAYEKKLKPIKPTE